MERQPTGSGGLTQHNWRGTDVLKAPTLSAELVVIGRPTRLVAAIGGENGVRHAIHLLSEEIARDMALLGVGKLAEFWPDLPRLLSARA